MDQTNEGVRTPPSASPSPSPTTQNLQVTPDNVIDLAVRFRAAADRLHLEARTIRERLHLHDHWMREPVSKWMQQIFNNYFVLGGNSFAEVVAGIHHQYLENAEALKKAAIRYGLGEELNAELFRRLGPTK